MVIVSMTRAQKYYQKYLRKYIPVVVEFIEKQHNNYCTRATTLVRVLKVLRILYHQHCHDKSLFILLLLRWLYAAKIICYMRYSEVQLNFNAFDVVQAMAICNNGKYWAGMFTWT